MQDTIAGEQLFVGRNMNQACREAFTAVTVVDEITCHSANKTVVQAAFKNQHCQVFFDGSETRGGDVDVVVKYQGRYTSQVPFRVWYPEALSIVPSDSALQPIAHSRDTSCPAHYQSCRLQAIATFSCQGQAPAVRNIDVTDIVSFKVLGPQTSLVTISGSTVQRRAGFVSADVGCDGPTNGPCGTAKVTITGDSSEVTVQDVIVWVVSKTDFKLSTNTVFDAETDQDGRPFFQHVQTMQASATLTSKLTAPGDTATVFARALFSDGTWSHSLTKATGLRVSSNQPCIDVDNSGPLPKLKIPDDPFECYSKNVLSIDWAVPEPAPCNSSLGTAKNAPNIRIDGREAVDRYIGVTGFVAVHRQVICANALRHFV